MEDYTIREFYPDLIAPTHENYLDPEQGGSKIVFIGKPGTGKSTLVNFIVDRKPMIPVGIVMNGTEESTGFYARHFPPLFIYNSYNENVLHNVIERQKKAKESIHNPWCLVILDDCTDKKNIFKSEIQNNIFKNGRHYKMNYYLIVQYSVDLPPALRTCVDGAFIFKETNERNLKSLYENYAGVFPNFKLFKLYMENITGDFTALYIDSQSQATKPWYECVYYFKAPEVGNYKFGCKEYRAYGRDRVNKKYLEDPLAKVKEIHKSFIKNRDKN